MTVQQIDNLIYYLYILLIILIGACIFLYTLAVIINLIYKRKDDEDE